MSWLAQLKADPLPWLLEDDTPGARYLALRNVLGAPEGAELRQARTAAHERGPIAAILSAMDAEGYWVTPGPGYNPKYRSTVWSMVLLAQLGAASTEDQRIRTACSYVLDHTLTAGGHFTASGAPSGTADCLQGNLCWALVELGCEDARLDTAFEWMARSVSGEGVAPMTEREAPRRYYAGKCGPTFACGSNNKLPCAWGAVKVMLAFARWPATRRTPLIERAIDQGVAFLLSTDPAMALYPTGCSDRPSSNWWKFGFPVFYVTDILQIGEALAGLGYGADARLAGALALIRDKQDALGRWALEYDYADKAWVDFGSKKQPSKWVTLRALSVLRAAGQ